MSRLCARDAALAGHTTARVQGQEFSLLLINIETCSPKAKTSLQKCCQVLLPARRPLEGKGLAAGTILSALKLMLEPWSNMCFTLYTTCPQSENP